MDGSSTGTCEIERPLTGETELRGDPLRRSLNRITFAWLFGSVWMTAVCGTPLTNYANSLQASAFQFGVLAALPFLASILSMPASLLIEYTGLRKRIFFWGLYLNRLMWIAIAIVPMWMAFHFGPESRPSAMIVFLGFIFVMHAGQAIGGPAWVSWMADIVPDRSRGKYFSRRRQWGLLTAVPTALLVGWVLDRYGSTDGWQNVLVWSAAIILLATPFGLLDIAAFHGVPNIHKEPQRGGSFFAAWKEPLHNRQFLVFAGFVGTLIFGICFVGQFWTLYILEQLGGSAGGNMLTQVMVIIVPSLAMLLVFGAWGRAVDRMGKRPVLLIGGLGMVPVGLLWTLVTKETIWLGYVLAAAGGIFWAGIEIANTNIVMQWSGSADEENGNAKGGSGYCAINALVINVAGCIGGLTAGMLAQYLKNRNWHWETSFKTFTYFDVLFLLSGVMRLAAVVIFVPFIKEPAARPTRETLRFMTANIYNNLFNAALLPLRLMRVGRRESYVQAEAVPEATPKP